MLVKPLFQPTTASLTKLESNTLTDLLPLPNYIPIGFSHQWEFVPGRCSNVTHCPSLSPALSLGWLRTSNIEKKTSRNISFLRIGRLLLLDLLV